jgi:glycosyltransferase involved in cell wall biosynthesis
VRLQNIKKMTFQFISVIIPTYKRLIDFEECLISIINQNYPKERYEIIAVDQGTEGIDKVLEKYRSNENLKFISKNKIGLSIARKVGAENSLGEVIAYIDDDAVADKNWLLNLSKGFQKDNIGIVGGKVLPIWGNNAKEIHKQKYSYTRSLFSLFDLGEKDRIVPHVIGVNFSVRKKLFSEFGFFDESVGRIGSSLLGGEETEFCERASKKYDVMYSANAIVHHKVLNYRLTTHWLIKRAYYGGLSKAFQGRKPKTIKKIKFTWLDYCLLIPYFFGYIKEIMKRLISRGI